MEKEVLKKYLLATGRSLEDTERILNSSKVESFEELVETFIRTMKRINQDPNFDALKYIEQRHNNNSKGMSR